MRSTGAHVPETLFAICSGTTHSQTITVVHMIHCGTVQYEEESTDKEHWHVNGQCEQSASLARV
jgi:hypothetical protein